jgi:hypothetical protein
MKKYQIIYYISTGLFTALMLFSISMYLFNTEEMAAGFDSFGYPVYLIYPLALAKFLGLVTLWFLKGKAITEWAYAGFFFNALLAFFAHYMIGDGKHMGALVAVILLLSSYWSYKKWF